MSQRFTIEISDQIAEQAQKIAAETDLPISDILMDKPNVYLAVATDDIDTLLAQVRKLSEVQLWWLIVQGFPEASLERMSHLGAQTKYLHGLSDAEQTEHEHLLQEYEVYILLRTEALVRLQEVYNRNVQAYLKRNGLSETSKSHALPNL